MAVIIKKELRAFGVRLSFAIVDLFTRHSDGLKSWPLLSFDIVSTHSCRAISVTVPFGVITLGLDK